MWKKGKEKDEKEGNILKIRTYSACGDRWRLCRFTSKQSACSYYYHARYKECSFLFVTNYRFLRLGKTQPDQTSSLIDEVAPAAGLTSTSTSSAPAAAENGEASAEAEDGGNARAVRSLEDEENALADEARYQLHQLLWPSNHPRYAIEVPGEVVVGGVGEIYIHYIFDLKVDSGLRYDSGVVNSIDKLYRTLQGTWPVRTYFDDLDSALVSAHNRIALIQQGNHGAEALPLCSTHRYAYLTVSLYLCTCRSLSRTPRPFREALGAGVVWRTSSRFRLEPKV